MLFDTVCSPEDLQALTRIIDVLNDSLYIYPSGLNTGKQSWTNVLDNQVSMDWRPYFVLPEEKRRDFLDDLKQQIVKYQVCHLKVGLSLPLGSIRRICAWMRKNIAAEIIIDIEVDPAIIYGAEISWQGKYLDLSGNSRLTNVLKTKYGQV